MKMEQKTLLGLVLVIIVGILFFLALFYLPQNFSERSEAVARVNGQIITETELNNKIQKSLETFSAQGQEISESQTEQIKTETLNNLIDEYLIVDYAEKNDIDASEEEINREYEILSFFYGGEENLLNELGSTNMGVEDFKNSLEINVIFKKSIANFMLPAEVTASEKEVMSVYQILGQQAQKSGLVNNLPPFEEASAWLAHQITGQKILNEAENFIFHLRNNSTVEVYL